MPIPFGPNTLTVIGMQQMVFVFDQRTIMMPYVMDSFKIGDATGIRGRALGLAMVGAVVVAVAVGSLAGLRTMYRYGGVGLDSWVMRSAAAWIPIDAAFGVKMNVIFPRE